MIIQCKLLAEIMFSRLRSPGLHNLRLKHTHSTQHRRETLEIMREKPIQLLTNTREQIITIIKGTCLNNN